MVSSMARCHRFSTWDWTGVRNSLGLQSLSASSGRVEEPLQAGNGGKIDSVQQRFAPHGGGADLKLDQADFDAGHVYHEREGVFSDLGGAGHEECMPGAEVDGLEALIQVGVEAVAYRVQLNAGNVNDVPA